MEGLISLTRLTLVMTMVACSTAPTTPVGPNGGPKLSEDERTDAGSAAAVSDACTTGPKVTVNGSQYSDETRGFELLLPPGFTTKNRGCGGYLSLEKTSPEANGLPRRVDIYANDSAFEPRGLISSTNAAGVTYFLIPGYGQETGQVSEWNLVVSGPTFFLTLQTDRDGKATLEEIVGSFRWTR
jgi:hypothetical protein